MAMDRHFNISIKGKILSFPGETAVVIGQAPGCDVTLPNTTRFEDEVMAKILPDKNGLGWHIIKTSNYYPVSVNGCEINRVHYLKDGDLIEVDRDYMRFNIKDGELSSPSVTHIHKSGKALWGAVGLIFIILSFVGYQFYDNQRESITNGMKGEIMTSVFTTRVDSLQLVCGDSVVDSYTYVSSPVGTAFLTTDSLIVTARHCIQPWLNMVLPHEYSHLPKKTEWPIAKALYAETENQLSGDEKWRVVSFITMTDEDGKTQSFSSDSFKINYDDDEIVELGSYDRPRYWRSISHRYTRRDMMLGDIAIKKTDKGGHIATADKEELQRLLNKRGTRLTFVGHPESSVNGSSLDFKTDELRLPLEEMKENQNRIFMISHEGRLTSGYSGGPVIVRDGVGFRAVGVVSVVDEQNGNRCYSVPTSEIKSITK